LELSAVRTQQSASAVDAQVKVKDSQVCRGVHNSKFGRDNSKLEVAVIADHKRPARLQKGIDTAILGYEVVPAIRRTHPEAEC